MYQVLMFSCDDGDLGGVRSFGLADARGMVEEARARKLAESGQGQKTDRQAAQATPGTTTGNGTPLGRAFRKFLGK
jgi:hypothetical protein